MKKAHYPPYKSVEWMVVEKIEMIKKQEDNHKLGDSSFHTTDKKSQMMVLEAEEVEMLPKAKEVEMLPEAKKVKGGRAPPLAPLWLRHCFVVKCVLKHYKLDPGQPKSRSDTGSFMEYNLSAIFLAC
ncbi:hypothetical protein SLEP1_g58131 [Rubroshorea leprosula]|uniref:Uncharacterized protein n=1 Tax=Rubroshorea leprosula TaxID=152421 RepID=A0AAV5MPK1_9ROSI|nr:hypothetical protein SLEP1_g58131 [Rubroshorea leprosula]